MITIETIEQYITIEQYDRFAKNVIVWLPSVMSIDIGKKQHQFV